MVIKRKEMSHKTWKRILDRKCATCELEEENIEGKAYLINMLKLTDKLIRQDKGKDIIIADEGYYWLSIGIENENFWLTAIYDKNKKFLQYYIDVTLENHVVNEEEPYYLDLFLDVVLYNSGNMYLLDEDELKIALDEKVITDQQFEFSYTQAKRIMRELPKQKERIDNICNKYLEKLIKKLD